MLFIHKTISLCDHCYRHIPANVIEEDDSIKIVKRCPEHGEMRAVVETDKHFYYGLQHTAEVKGFNQILFEVTDRCQLNCPHCYHLPDNKTTDRAIEDIVCQVKEFSKEATPMLAGAEPTLRPDFVELCKAINDLGFKRLDVLTNGLRFADREFAQSCFDAGLGQLSIGLNHHSYQGEKIHAKQLTAIQTALDVGFYISYIGYTLETREHLPDVLDEIIRIRNFSIENIWQFRIRCGSFIGRSNDSKRSYLSDTVKAVIDYLGKDKCEIVGLDDNPYHVVIKYDGTSLRIIQWPDVTNIDMEELNTGPWCQFYTGPITNFVHQVITRDYYKNMNKSALDQCPPRYQHQTPEQVGKSYWKYNWQGPIEIEELDWTYVDRPKPIFTLTSN
jgi:organic radical activating enzyme